MLKLINKKYSQYHVWTESKLSAAVHSNWRKPRPQFDVADAKLEFEFPEDLNPLED